MASMAATPQQNNLRSKPRCTSTSTSGRCRGYIAGCTACCCPLGDCKRLEWSLCRRRYSLSETGHRRCRQQCSRGSATPGCVQTGAVAAQAGHAMLADEHARPVQPQGNCPYIVAGGACGLQQTHSTTKQLCCLDQAPNAAASLQVHPLALMAGYERPMTETAALAWPKHPNTNSLGNSDLTGTVPCTWQRLRDWARPFYASESSDHGRTEAHAKQTKKCS